MRATRIQSCMAATLPLAGVMGVLLLSWPGHAATEQVAPFRVGFASSMFTDVNENDARAAVKVWGQTLARERGVPTDPDPLIFKTVEQLRSSLEQREVDAVALTLLEYDLIRRDVNLAPIFLTYNSGSTTEQYVLLAHRDGPVQTMADLRGRHLLSHSNPRTCLAPLWLDTLLVEAGLPAAAALAGKTTLETKLSRVVLPVFFRQADACVVTRSGFAMMSELNPQLGKQLVVLAASEAMVPAVFAFRADYAPPYRETLLAGVRDLHSSPAGQQVLTIFHSERIEEQLAASLDSALELIAAHAQLSSGTNAIARSATPGSVGQPGNGEN